MNAQAALPWRFLLCFQEQIQAPENAPIARFDGLGRYQTRSKPARACGAWRGQKNSSVSATNKGVSSPADHSM